MASASLDSVHVDEINDLLTCSMCLETLNEPRSLPCFHNFCEVCLGKYVQRLRGADKTLETFPCPTCRSEFALKSNEDVADLASSYFIKNMLEIMAIQKKAKESATCSRCQHPAINHCASCEIFMCTKCSESHDSWLKNHDVLSVQDLNDPHCQIKRRSKLYCVKHKDKILEYYCETCEELCCIHCLVLSHQKQNHLCVEVSEATEKQKQTLQSNCTALDAKLSEGKKALNIISEVMKSVEKNAKTAKDEIKEQNKNILKIVTEKLDERAERLNEKVDEVYGVLYGELSKQHDEIKDYLEKIQASVSLPKNLLKRGSIEEMLSSQRLINENIERLKGEQPDSLDPVNDGGIVFVPEEIQNINLYEIVGKLGDVTGAGSNPKRNDERKAPAKTKSESWDDNANSRVEERKGNQRDNRDGTRHAGRTQDQSERRCNASCRDRKYQPDLRDQDKSGQRNRDERIRTDTREGTDTRDRRDDRREDLRDQDKSGQRNGDERIRTDTRERTDRRDRRDDRRADLRDQGKSGQRNGDERTRTDTRERTDRRAWRDDGRRVNTEQGEPSDRRDRVDQVRRSDWRDHTDQTDRRDRTHQSERQDLQNRLDQRARARADHPDWSNLMISKYLRTEHCNQIQ